MCMHSRKKLINLFARAKRNVCRMHLQFQAKTFIVLQYFQNINLIRIENVNACNIPFNLKQSGRATAICTVLTAKVTFTV
jgi:hypothetical protein